MSAAHSGRSNVLAVIAIGALALLLLRGWLGQRAKYSSIGGRACALYRAREMRQSHC